MPLWGVLMGLSTACVCNPDVDAVKKLFSTLASVLEKLSGNMQIIVLDHASDTVWGGIQNIHCVAEWRNQKRLIPESWYNDKSV